MGNPIDGRLAANTRWKREFRSTLAVSVTLAGLAHGLVIEMWPTMSATVFVDGPTTDIDVVRVDEYDLPNAPTELARPAAPLVTPGLDVSATLPTVEFDRVPELPPPPRPDRAPDGAAAPPFTPYTIPPELRNPDQVQRALMAAYPVTLRDAGVGGTVVLHLHLDETGRVVEARVSESSGYGSMDAAALDLTEIMSFRPAWNRDQRVAVWVRVPVTFRVP